MLHGWLLLADGFEVTEALGTLDLLRRTHQIDVKTVSISDARAVLSSCGVTVLADERSRSRGRGFLDPSRGKGRSR